MGATLTPLGCCECVKDKGEDETGAEGITQRLKRMTQRITATEMMSKDGEEMVGPP